jgi:hypothetical protein
MTLVHLRLQRWRNPLCPPLTMGERKAPGDLRQQLCTNLVRFHFVRAICFLPTRGFPSESPAREAEPAGHPLVVH